ncbi:MAG: 16S rRNA (cytidine(1402)-2'-O)-methyltransferase [Caldilineaceae bacterium]|nr:16S rRNA (cytidine(1402)-2'-O)-methyltransferase [Caldilineaceae bacterium]
MSTLYLVSTPIGNLGDITQRALETLQSVDIIASEDTRTTGRLLKHFAIDTPQVAFHEHNETQAGERILELLQAGQSVALVTDAGTPGIADPGFTLVRRVYAAQDAGADVSVTMAPGPAALTMALVLSGLPVHSFTFRGFPPHKRGARQRFIAVDAEAPHTLVFYESPYRIGKFLSDALEVLGDRPAAVLRELTKLHEEVRRGTLSELAARYGEGKGRGEFVVVIGGRDA